MLDVDSVVYVDDVADDGGKSTGSGGLVDLLAVWITAHTNNASSTSPADSRGHYHRLLVVPAGLVVVTAHAGMLGPAGQDLLRTPGKRTLQERAEADPANPERPERRGIILVGQRDRVDRQWQLGSQAPQRIRVVTAHRVQRIGARRRGFFQPRDRTVDTVGFVAVLP